MALSTTDLGTGTGMPKTITPGNNVLKINSIHLEDFSFIEGAYHLMLNVETPAIDGFEGFQIDKIFLNPYGRRIDSNPPGYGYYLPGVRIVIQRI